MVDPYDFVFLFTPLCQSGSINNPIFGNGDENRDHRKKKIIQILRIPILSDLLGWIFFFF